MPSPPDHAFSLPEGCVLRSAKAEDIGTIRKLVWMARLDPTQIRWPQFWVIECDRHIVACGQLRNYSDAQELSSLVVLPEWRGKGLGTYLALHLIQAATKLLYLECLGEQRVQFYSRLGFVPVSWQALPRSLKRKFGFTQLIATVFRLPLQIMHYPILPD